MRNITIIGFIIAVFLSVSAGALSSPPYPEVTPGTAITFPKDHGAHNDFRTEWWYFTGWLETENGEPLGFQITFFRTRPDIDSANPSAFAPQQIIFAHAALSDPKTGTLIHDQRIGRAGFGVIGAASEDTDVQLLDWRLDRNGNGIFESKVQGREFALNLQFQPTQPPMLNGDAGYSRKGPRPSQASYYYSMPQLAVTGIVERKGQRSTVAGQAWLDREWSSDVLPQDAVGWDWTGLNFDDGSALMAFRVRDAQGHSLYAGGSFRSANGTQTSLSPDDVRFVPKRRWTSPDTGGVYPVEAVFIVKIDGQEKRFLLRPMFDAQELTGPFTPAYWEGAVTTQGGRGYLEMTGYADAIKI